MEIKKVRTKNYQTKEYQTKEYTAKKKKNNSRLYWKSCGYFFKSSPFLSFFYFSRFRKNPPKIANCRFKLPEKPTGKESKRKKKKKKFRKGLEFYHACVVSCTKIDTEKKKKKWCMYRIHVWKTPIFLSSLVPCVCYFYKGSCELV